MKNSEPPREYAALISPIIVVTVGLAAAVFTSVFGFFELSVKRARSPGDLSVTPHRQIDLPRSIPSPPQEPPVSVHQGLKPPSTKPWPDRPPLAPAPYYPSEPAPDSLPSQGMLDYTAPHEVKFPEPFNVDVAITRVPPKTTPIAPRTGAEKEKLGLSSLNPMTNQAIEVSQLMDVELSSLDPGAFNVAATDARPKQLQENGHAEWHWVVTPNQTGEKHLRLHWQSIQILPNGTLAPPEDLGTAFATITVNVEPLSKRIIPESGKFISENWKKILGYFLPPSGFALLLWIWAKMRGKTPPSLIPKEGQEKEAEAGKDEDAD
jgi:hypothetical protein